MWLQHAQELVAKKEALEKKEAILIGQANYYREHLPVPHNGLGLFIQDGLQVHVPRQRCSCIEHFINTGHQFAFFPH